MRRLRDIFTKLTLAWMAGVLVVSSFVFTPSTATAQGVPVIDSSLVGFETKDEIEERIQQPLAVALIQILLNLISFVANRLAYDAAIAISSGGAGQSPNYEYRSLEEYGSDLWADILGESIGQLSQGLDVVGVEFDVCAPTSPLKRLNLQLGIAAGASRPAPTCDFRDIQANWEGFVASISEDGDPNRLFDEFAASFTSGRTELGATVSILTQTYGEAQFRAQVGTDEVLANNRFNDVTDPITGLVKTPADVLANQFQSKLEDAQGNQTEALQGALFGNEGALLQIGVSAGSVFLNTLLSQLTNKVYTGLFEPPTTGGVFNPDFINIRGRDRARETFKGLLTTPIQTLDQYNIVNQFVTCPGGTNRGPNNCVMDTGFAAAIARAEAGDPLTIQDAIDAGLLKGDWPLISSADTARNNDAFCYTYGYCYSNLVKMRIARILPVGLELAADKSGQGNIPVQTLQDVVDAFNDCNYDNPDQLLDSNNPFCHLVDPNWVIKYPETQCRAQVNGQTLIADNADVRAQTCVDTPSCIAEDENGNCIGGYGYCTRERNVWRFGGDVCPAEYASCTTLTSREGQRASYLTNTVDFGECDADSAGCTWYRTEQALDDNGTPADPSDDSFVWVDVDPTSSVDASSVRTYMNANAQLCDPSDAGCTEVVRASTSPLNPVLNASFETDADQDGVPDSWSMGAGVEYRTSGTDAAFGSDALYIPSGQSINTTNPIKLGPNQFVTVSGYARAQTGASATVGLLMTFLDGVGGTAVPSVAVNSPNCTYIGGAGIQSQVAVQDTYERFSCTFSTPDYDSWMTIGLTGVGNVFADGFQVDEQEVTTAFHVGYGASADRVNLRIAPDYLGCTGEATDPEACGNYAPVCSAAEVGCTAYTPTNGDPTVPGITNSNDLCPTECVGYETYRQLETNFSQDVFPVYFIADTADSCTAAAAGCSEFTNLDALNEGGESLAYFTDVRVCQEVAEAAGTDAVFYTWEGSDSVGFQLRTWTLKQSQLNDAPCTSFDAATGTCTDATTTAPTGCTQHSDIFLDPDCREFYDEDGDIHYRYYSDTITVDNACSPFRKTASTQIDCSTSGGVWNGASGNCTYNIMASESATCSASENACRGYTGNTGNNTRVALREYFEDGTLTNWSGFPAAPTYSNESVAAGGRSMEINTAVNGVTATASLGQIQDGYSYILSFWAKGSAELEATLVSTAGGSSQTAYFVENLAVGAGWQEYTFGPLDPSLVSGFDASTATLQFAKNSPGTVFIDNVTLREVQDTVYLIENSWVTPSTCDQTPQGVAAPQYHLGCQEYRTHRGTTTTLKSFTSICREQAIGCEGFYDTQNSSSPSATAYNLTCSIGTPASGPTPCSFNNEEVCTVLSGQTSCTFTYEGLDRPGALAPVVTEASEIVPRDEKIFVVDLPEYRCGNGAQGCTLYGSPVFSTDNASVASFDTVAIINNPDEYDQTLCEQNELFCEAYSTDQGAVYYFKNPNNQTCDYKNGVTIDGSTYSGWFRSGTSEPCYYDDANDNGTFDVATELLSSYLIGGSEFGVWRNGDTANYDGWVATCPAEQNSCSEFLDVVDTAEGLYPNGRPYYYLNNEKIDQSEASPSESCDGLISQEEGCVGFSNNATPFSTFSTSASYVKSWHANELVNADQPFTPVDPVDCSVEGGGVYTLPDGSTVDLCLSQCAYANVIGYDGGDPVEQLELGGACITNTDCGTRTDAFGNDVAGTCLDLRGINTPVGICLNATNSGATCSTAADCTGAGALCANVAEASLNDNGTLGQVNDANTILKVRRDRQCSEWLACDSQFTAWDENRGEYVNVCNSVSLCNEFSTLGSQAFCSNWVDAPQELLTEQAYANRDVTWYGSEFSGYSIPNQFGVQDYSQVNVNPDRWCAFSGTNNQMNAAGEVTTFNEASGTWSNGTPVSCTAVADCTAINPSGSLTCASADEDWRLTVELGPCSGAEYSSCTVGTCSETGLACGDAGDCSSGESCDVSFGNTEQGQCIQGACVATVSGGTTVNASTDVAVRQECRGYPQENAPFPNDIVREWTDSFNDSLDTSERPLSFINGFQNANYCQNGEACECSYLETQYDGGLVTEYYELGSNSDESVCSGGPTPGAACTSDSQCGNGGVCAPKTSENTYIGWNGFCIQKDLSITLNGNQDRNACLLWLPVDQLRGGTDIYGKQTEAGFSINNAAYCVESELFIDVGVTGAYDAEGDDGINDGIQYACADAYPGSATQIPTPSAGFNDPATFFLQTIIGSAVDGAREHPGDTAGSAGGSCSQGEWDNCWASAACPKNHFAVIGSCDDTAQRCVEGGVNGGAYDDCPYFCVPYGSRVESPNNETWDVGDLCEPPTEAQYKVPINSFTLDIGLTQQAHSEGTWDGSAPSSPGPAQAWGYLVSGPDTFSEMIARYASCQLRGVEWNADNIEDNYYLPLWPADSATYYDFENYYADGFMYLGCSELAYASVEEGFAAQGLTNGETGNTAYTNRVLSPADAYTLNEAGLPIALGYTTDTQPDEVGQIATSYGFESASEVRLIDPTLTDMGPSPVAMCASGGGVVTPSESALAAGGACEAEDLGRSFGDTFYTLPTSITGEESCQTDADCGGSGTNVCLDSSSNDYACFIECGEFALKYNPAAQPFLSGSWDQAEGTAFCNSVGLGACVAYTNSGPVSNGAIDQPIYTCATYFGHPSTPNSAGSQSAALGTIDNVCAPAAAAGIIPNLGSGGSTYAPNNTTVGLVSTFLDSQGVTTATWTDSSGAAQTLDVGATTGSSVAAGSPFSQSSFQCDGGGPGSDNACSNNADCNGGSASVCINNTCSVTTNYAQSDIIPVRQRQDGIGTSLTRLQQFFARIYAFWTYEDDTDNITRTPSANSETIEAGVHGAYAENDGRTAGYGVGDLDKRTTNDGFGAGPNDGNPTAPQVAGVTSNCVNSNCVEDSPGTFSVNGSTGRTWLTLSSFLADLKFFAWTDPNQYPLRKVIVDWGDGYNDDWGPTSIANEDLWGRGSVSGSTADDNYYKARRGLNPDQSAICEAEDQWGATEDSCSEGPFQFQHHYRCTSGMISWLVASERTCEYVAGTNQLVNSPCYEPTAEEFACVFQPRVHVLDNWDYCTGSCPGTANGSGAECYGLNQNSLTASDDECNLNTWPIDPSAGPDPWIYWDGTITVQPI